MIVQNGKVTIFNTGHLGRPGPFERLFSVEPIDKTVKILKRNYVKNVWPTDLAKILGSFDDKYEHATLLGDPSASGNARPLFRCLDDDGDVCTIHNCEHLDIRPIIPVDVTKMDKSELNENAFGYIVVEYGEYPQFCDRYWSHKHLEEYFQGGDCFETGRSFTLEIKGQTIKFPEYFCSVNGKRFIRLSIDLLRGKRWMGNGDIGGDSIYFKDVADNFGALWIEVKPIEWFLDKKSGLLISYRPLLSGFANNGFYDFENSEIYGFLNNEFVNEINAKTDFSKYKQATGDSSELEKIEEEKPKYQFKKANPYGFKVESHTPEQTIESAMKAGVAVFLHGKSSDGKSARVKQIDPDCEIVYLRNATPESLNGKSVYNAKTGEMKDIKPTWLVRLEEKCAKEPDKLHILFLDEIANALPSIQGIAFNIVLDREVNGRWKLPENARIVAAGNEITDSLAAQPIAEPLFNRFAHVYIKTTTESWLRWASDMDIHPAIYAYIAYKKGEVLRTEYTGDKPNADPRKWEMASKMLYATNNPESIVSLVGEEITKEFIEFCKREVLTLEDVLNDNYDDKKLESLDTSERYATIIGLTQVDNKDVEKVIKFTKILGAEYEAVFESMWASNDEERLEIIVEIKMADGSFSI